MSWRVSCFALFSVLQLSLDMSILPIAMTEPNYRAIYEELSAKVAELWQLRTELEVKLGDITKELESLEETLAHFGPLAGYGPSEFDPLITLGITDAVRSVLSPTTRMAPSEIKASMEQRGFDFSKYSAPDASVRTILKRLVEAGKASFEKEGHKIFYKYAVTDEEIPF
jgi:hypothetical protein